MRFTKFFRRYSRTLLMVFMSLLLVTFLIQPVLQNMSRSGREQKTVIGHSKYGDVTYGDLATAEGEERVLALLGFDLPAIARAFGLKPLQPLDSRLLMEEAEQMGVHVGREDVDAALAQRWPADQVQQGLARIEKQYHFSADRLYALIGRSLAVQQVLQMQQDALAESEPRTEVAYRDANQKADVQVAVVDSRAFTGRVPEPTDEELQAFFEAGKDRFAAHTDDQLEFGYRLPDRVRIEYVTIDPTSIEPKIHARDRELENYFKENARKYTKSVAAEQPSASAPSQTSIPMTFEEAKDQVRRDYIKSQAVAEAQRLMNQLHDSVYHPWQVQRPDEQGFRPEPKEALVSFKDLQAQVGDRAEVTYADTPLMSEEELQKYFDSTVDFQKQFASGQIVTGEPIYAEGDNKVPASQLAFRVRKLYTPTKNDRLPVLNLNEPSPVINTRATSITEKMRREARPTETPYQPYMFRVVQAEPSAPPDSLDQVREQVRSDYKLTKAHAIAGEYAGQLAEAARSAGLAAAVEQATELKQILNSTDAPLSPIPTSAPSQSPYVKELGPAAPLQPVTRNSDRLGTYLTDSRKMPREVFQALDDPAPGSAPAHVVAEGQVAKLFKWAVVEVEGIKPIYRGEFEQQRARLQRSGAGTVAREVMGGWLDPEHIRQRTAFKSLNAAATEAPSD